MHSIVVAIVGWGMAAFGSLMLGTEHIAGTGLVLSGVLLVIARAAAVRFDRLFPPPK